MIHFLHRVSRLPLARNANGLPELPPWVSYVVDISPRSMLLRHKCSQWFLPLLPPHGRLQTLAVIEQHAVIGDATNAYYYDLCCIQQCDASIKV
jgi:hypothetical protein